MEEDTMLKRSMPWPLSWPGLVLAVALMAPLDARAQGMRPELYEPQVVVTRPGLIEAEAQGADTSPMQMGRPCVWGVNSGFVDGRFFKKT